MKSVPLIIYASYLQATHLHKDVLNIDMAEQLGLILARATDDYRSELQIYCDEVAYKNGIDTKKIEMFANKHNRQYLVRLFMYLIESISKCQNELLIDSAKYSVKNVYGAAILTHTLYQFNCRDKYWRLFNLKRFSGKIMLRLWRVVAQRVS